MSAPAPKLSLFRQRLRSSFSSTPTNPDLSTLSSTPLTPSTTQPAVPQSPTELAVETKLDVLDQILTRLEAATPVSPPEVETPDTGVPPVADSDAATVVPEVVVSPLVATPSQAEPETEPPAVEPLADEPAVEPSAIIEPPPVHVSSLSKESVASMNPDRVVVDAGAGVQVVEYEPSSELPVEVESYLQEVQDHQTQQPQEILITDGQMQIQPAAMPKKSVIVLPITPEVEAAGAKKSPKWSIRWLVEWSRKLIKTFSGKIVYREVST